MPGFYSVYFCPLSKIHLSVTGKDPDLPKIISDGQVSAKADDVAVTIDERLPLVHREPQVTIDVVRVILNKLQCFTMYVDWSRMGRKIPTNK